MIIKKITTGFVIQTFDTDTNMGNSLKMKRAMAEIGNLG